LHSCLEAFFTVNHKILIDTDPGVDDAMALLLAVASPELNIIGVTTVFGNGADVSAMSRNALAVLSLAGRTDIPVTTGAATPLVAPYPGRGKAVHGENGLGGVGIPDSLRGPEALPAAQFIVDQCRAQNGEITLVTLAPLTNLALALRLEPKLPELVKQVVVMGGAVNVGGNITPAAEANIYNDPEAARMVFNAGWPIAMAGMNVTCQVRVAETYLAALAKAGNRAGRFIDAAAQAYLAFYRGEGEDGICMHDVHTIMYLIRPDLYQATAVTVDVELRGELTRGQTVADWRNRWGRTPQTRLLTTVDSEEFLQEFRTRIARLP
jgi:inosine-uridine nucleoside N-ribohydrolase